jgi:hypothetical protein
MQVPLVVEQRRVPVWPARQSSRPASRHVPHVRETHDTPDTLALQARVSVAVDVSEQVAPAPAAPHVGVLHMRDCEPVRSHVLGIVCVQADQGAQVVAPHAAPLGAVQACISFVMPCTHVPPMHAGVVVVRVCMPVGLQVAPTRHVDHAPTVTEPHARPSVVRMHGCVSSVSIAAHTPPAQCEVVVTRVCTPVCVHGSENVHVDQSP